MTRNPKDQKPKPARSRLDGLLVARGLAESRAKAQALILARRVQVDGVPVTKAGALVAPEAEITLKPGPAYVSRGGEKLAAALKHFQVSPQGKVCLDAGVGTGGFTQVLLLGGAVRVYAVDVGYGQLDPSLRQDPRVVVLERQNIRLLPKDTIPEPVDLVTLDLSFISLTLVIPKILEFTRPGSEILALVKPQFEVGKGQVGKGGVVRDPVRQQAAVAKVAHCARGLGLQVSEGFPCPLKGPKGNQEYFLYVKVPENVSPPPEIIDKPLP